MLTSSHAAVILISPGAVVIPTNQRALTVRVRVAVSFSFLAVVVSSPIAALFIAIILPIVALPRSTWTCQMMETHKVKLD